MKKRKILFYILLLSVQCGFAQVYYVTRVSGDIRFNNKPLKSPDQLTDLCRVYSRDRKAELFLFNPKKGKVRLSFAHGKPVKITADESGKPEWFELTVGEFLLDYTFDKTLTVRGEFDLFTFFNNADNEGAMNKILLVEGQSLPVKSKKLGTQPGDKFFFCVIKRKDTLCSALTRKKDELIFDKNNNLSQQDTCIIKLSYTENGNYREEYFPTPVLITYMKPADLKALVDLFKKGLSTVYHNNNDKLLDDIEDHLTYCYGNYYQPAIRQLILADLN